MLVELAALRRQRLLSDDLALGLTALTELRARPPSLACPRAAAALTQRSMGRVGRVGRWESGWISLETHSAPYVPVVRLKCS